MAALLSSLLAPLAALAAQPPSTTPFTSRDAPHHTVTASACGDCLFLPAAAAAVRSLLSLQPATAPSGLQRAAGEELYATDASDEQSTGSSNSPLQCVWPPHRSAQCELSFGASCFDLPAAPSPFIQLPAHSPDTAALTGVVEWVHSSAWSGVWQWSSADGSLHSQQHQPSSWPHSRLAPATVRPLSAWSDFHRGSTQRSLHNPYGGGAQQRVAAAVSAQPSKLDDTRARLFPFDSATAAPSTARAALLDTAPVIGVTVSDAATNTQPATEQPQQSRQSTPPTAAPYRIQADAGRGAIDEADGQSATDTPNHTVSHLAPYSSPLDRLTPLPHAAARSSLTHSPLLFDCVFLCVCACQARVAAGAAVAESTAPPDLAETALLLEWEAQWRQTALQQQTAEAARQNGAQADSRSTGGVAARTRATQLSSHGDGQPRTRRWLWPILWLLLSMRWHGDHSLTRCMRALCLRSYACSTATELELDKLLEADEWLDGGSRGAQSQPPQQPAQHSLAHIAHRAPSPYSLKSSLTARSVCDCRVLACLSVATGRTTTAATSWAVIDRVDVAEFREMVQRSTGALRWTTTAARAAASAMQSTLCTAVSHCCARAPVTGCVRYRILLVCTLSNWTCSRRSLSYTSRESACTERTLSSPHAVELDGQRRSSLRLPACSPRLARLRVFVGRATACSLLLTPQLARL